MSIENFYENIPKEYLNDDYYNPNKNKGVPLHPFRMIIAGASGSGKTNLAINLLKSCNNYERIYLFGKSLDQPLYKFLISKFEIIGAKLGQKMIFYSESLKDFPALTELDKSKQSLVIFDDLILEKSLKTVEEVYVRGRHFNLSVCFLSQSFFSIPKIIRLNSNYVVLRGIESIRDFKMIVSNYSLNETPTQLYSLYKKATEKSMSYFMIDLQSMDPRMKYRRNYEPISISQISTQKIKKTIKTI